MKRDELIKIVNDTLVGKEYCISNNASDVRKELQKAYPNIPLQSDWISKENIGYVMYKRHYLVGFKVFKKRGEYRRYFGYQWLISKVEVFNWFETIEERIKKIDEEIQVALEKEDKEHNIKVENFKKVRAVFPNLEWWDFQKLLKGVIEVAYDEIEKENNDEKSN